LRKYGSLTVGRQFKGPLFRGLDHPISIIMWWGSSILMLVKAPTEVVVNVCTDRTAKSAVHCRW